ncbi:MAG: M23 family metallopeptidase [Ignavibacteria bacterium]|jgi:murein DD-endopeptidase MepM/ murein hydrolase activator NlpD
MSLFDFNRLKKSSIYVTPNLPVIQTKRYKINLGTLLGILGIYTFIISVIVITIFALTPAKEVIFILENEELNVQKKRIEQLEKKIVFLSNEIGRLASTNRKLQYAIILAGIDSLDSTSTIYDSLRYDSKTVIPGEGNILKAFREFWNIIDGEKESNQKQETLFFMKPINGIITKEFQPEKGHMGIDFGVKTGTPVSAAAGGLVIFSDYVTGYGNTIIIEHRNNYISKYHHCSVLIKKEREVVKQGEVIALSGNSGSKSTGPHLHFELWFNGKPVNPKKHLINIY